MIVKVQLPLYPPDAPEALVYNEDATVYVQIPITPELRETMEGHYKKFFEANYDEAANTIKFTKEAPYREW